MKDEKLQEKIEELKNYEEKTRENYQDFFRGCSVKIVNELDSQSGQSAKSARWKSPGDSNYQGKALKNYEKWFSQAEVLVKNYYRSKLDEFRNLSTEFRKRLSLQKPAAMNKEKTIMAQNANFYQQVAIVEAIPERKETSSLKFRKELKEDLAKEEIVRAKKLFDRGHMRASGVLAGVSLERHLMTLYQEINTEEEPNDNIKGLAQDLRDQGLITENKKSHLQHLSNIRNSCAHAEEELPDERDIERMLNDIQDFISEY